MQCKTSLYLSPMSNLILMKKKETPRNGPRRFISVCDNHVVNMLKIRYYMRERISNQTGLEFHKTLALYRV